MPFNHEICRRPGTSIRINDDIEVRVIGRHGRQVRIGISAPRNYQIVRLESFPARSAEQANGDEQMPTPNESQIVISISPRGFT